MGEGLDIFSLVYHFSLLSPSRWETARYRLKYCLKGPFSPQQPTNQIYICLRDVQIIDTDNSAMALVCKHQRRYKRKAIFTCFGRTDVLNVNMKAFVSFRVPFWRILILRTAMTPCVLIFSRISCSLHPDKSGQQTKPLQVLREVCRDTLTSR